MTLVRTLAVFTSISLFSAFAFPISNHFFTPTIWAFCLYRCHSAHLFYTLIVHYNNSFRALPKIVLDMIDKLFCLIDNCIYKIEYGYALDEINYTRCTSFVGQGLCSCRLNKISCLNNGGSRTLALQNPSYI